MRKIILSLMLSSVVIVANATIIVDELFDYNASNLTDVSTWNHAGDLKSGTGRTLQKGGLVYSNTGGTYALSGAGKTLKSDVKTGQNTVAEAYVSYKALPNGPISSGNIYLSFLYKANGNQTQPSTDIIGLAATSAVTTLKAQAARQEGPDKISNPFRIGVNNTTANSRGVYASTFFEKNNVYLIVVKYSFDTKIASIYIDPVIASATEPAPNAATTTPGTIKSLENLMFYSTGTNAISNFFISGVRVATTWAEAVAAK